MTLSYVKVAAEVHQEGRMKITYQWIFQNPVLDFCCYNIGTPPPRKPMEATEPKSEKHTPDKIQDHSEPCS